MAKNRKYKKSSVNWQIERINPKKISLFQRKLVLEHLERYKFTKKFIKNKIVVDLGCGTGYGCDVMASKGAKKVYGVDISSEAILFAKKNYSDQKISFFCEDIIKTKLPTNFADTVVSFEVIEHCKNYKEALKEVKRVLKPDGIFVLSTPNKNLSLEDNPYHFKEFNLEELKNLLNNFGSVKFYGQRRVLGAISKLYKKLSEIFPGRLRFFLRFRPWESYSISPIKNPSDPSYLYLIVVCKNKKKNYLK